MKSLRKKIKILLRYPRFLISYLTNYKIIPMPWSMSWEVTYRCNSQCKYCDRWRTGKKNKKEELTTKEAKKMIKQAKQLGVNSVVFTGGEPLLRDDIFEIAQYTRKIGMETKLATNGFLISEKSISKIKESFDSINISLDSVKPEIHDKQRSLKGSHKKAMKALTLLSKNKCNFGFQTVVTKDNVDEILKLNQLAKKMQCNFYMNPVNDTYDTMERVYDRSILDLDFNKFNKKWGNVLEKFQYPNWFNKFTYKKFYRLIPQFLKNPSSLRNQFICFAGTYNFFVGPYGDVYACESLRMSLGNVKKSPLINIWKNMRGVRRKISSKHRECVCWYGCTAKDYMFLSRFIGLLKRGTK